VTAIPQTATIAAPPAPRLERARFCSRCASMGDEPDAHGLPYGFDRVCKRCGMGVMLSAPRKVLAPGAAALVVITREGRISAVSEQAEHLIGEEAGLLGMPITSAVASAEDDGQFVRLLARAAGGGREITTTNVLPATPGGGRPARMSAQIASCGPPRAALLVLERAAI